MAIDYAYRVQGRDARINAAVTSVSPLGIGAQAMITALVPNDLASVALDVKGDGENRSRERGRCRRPGRLGRCAHGVGAEGGGRALNPYTTPDRLLISRRPQDMRAGIQRLAAIVTAEFGMDPADGALYCFVSRDCEFCLAIRYPQLRCSTENGRR